MMNHIRVAVLTLLIIGSPMLFSCSTLSKLEASPEPTSAPSSNTWFEDFEEGNFDKWNFLLNQQGIQVVTLEGSGGNRVAEVKAR
jgi:hypothetical protein